VMAKMPEAMRIVDAHKRVALTRSLADKVTGFYSPVEGMRFCQSVAS
jgi:hypothetical protein